MDALSDVLSLLKPASYMFRSVDAAGRWAIGFEAHRGINCYAVLKGQAWLAVDGVAGVLLTEGECVLLPRGLPFRIGSALDVAPVDAWDLFPAVEEGGVISINGGGDVFGVGGYFAFESRHADILLDVLPPIVHIRQASDRAVLIGAMERITEELRTPLPGSFLMARHLAHLVLLQALRIILADGPDGGSGWIYGLADKQIGAALNALHGDPARKWTIQVLADIAAMSRSKFALRFRELVGASPIDYLTRWRMLLAADRIVTTRDPISVIAPALGYDSESAFSTAFKRVMGCAPRAYLRDHVRDDTRGSGPANVNF